MARYCNWSTETPRYERCLEIAEPGGSRCSKHPTKRPSRKGDLTDRDKDAIREKFGRKCAVCGQPANEVDHIAEFSRFAPDDKWKANLPSNLQLLCFHHHAEKTAQFRRSISLVAHPDDTSTSARNRKKQRRRQQGIYY